MRSHRPHVSFEEDRITAPPLHWFETTPPTFPSKLIPLAPSLPTGYLEHLLANRRPFFLSTSGQLLSENFLQIVTGLSQAFDKAMQQANAAGILGVTAHTFQNGDSGGHEGEGP